MQRKTKFKLKRNVKTTNKTKKRRQTHSGKKILGGSMERNSEFGVKLEALYKEREDLQREINDIEGRIYTIETDQAFTNTTHINLNSFKKNKNKVGDKIRELDKKIQKEEETWNIKGNKILTNIANEVKKNALKRTQPNHMATVGNVTLLLISITGVFLAILETKHNS